MNNKQTFFLLALLTASTGFLCAADQEDYLMPEGGNPNYLQPMKRPRYVGLPDSPQKPKVPVSPNSKAMKKQAAQQKAAAVALKAFK